MSARYTSAWVWLNPTSCSEEHHSHEAFLGQHHGRCFDRARRGYISSLSAARRCLNQGTRHESFRNRSLEPDLFLGYTGIWESSGSSLQEVEFPSNQELPISKVSLLRDNTFPESHSFRKILFLSCLQLNATEIAMSILNLPPLAKNNSVGTRVRKRGVQSALSGQSTIQNSIRKTLRFSCPPPVTRKLAPRSIGKCNIRCTFHHPISACRPDSAFSLPLDKFATFPRLQALGDV